jgi:hypothetical protein
MSGGYYPAYSSGSYSAPQQGPSNSTDTNQGFVQVPNNRKQP